MEPIYKIGNRNMKKPNRQNQCSMQSQYEKEQQRIQNKRNQMQKREENMRKLHNGTYLEKREVYDQILKVQKDFQNAREDRLKNDKQQELLQEYKGIAFFSEQEKLRQEKEQLLKQKNHFTNQQNFKLEYPDTIQQPTANIPTQIPSQNKSQRQRYYKNRNQLIFEQNNVIATTALFQRSNRRRFFYTTKPAKIKFKNDTVRTQRQQNT